MKKSLPFWTLVTVAGVYLLVRGSFSRAQDSSSPLPSGWTNQDLGPVSSPGSVLTVNSGYQISGSGGNISRTSDAYQFMYQPWTGDALWSVRVLDLTAATGWAKAGLVVRAGTAPGAAGVMLAVTLSHGIVFERRLTPGGISDRDVFPVIPAPGMGAQRARPAPDSQWSTPTGNAASISAPCFLRLLRQGDNFSAYYSLDGTNWQWLATERIPMPAGVEAGFAATSQTAAQSCVAQFDQLSVQTPAPANPPAPGGSGLGLSVTYTDQNTTNSIQRIDPTIDFVWMASESPVGTNSAQLSALWEGAVEPQYTEPYALQLIHSGGARLWLGGQLLIDDWQRTGLEQSRVVVSLAAGTRYPVSVEYAGQGSSAASAWMNLRWSSPSTPKQSIPASQLYPLTGGGQPDTSPATGQAFDLSAGLVALQATDQLPGLDSPWLNRVIGGPRESGTVQASNDVFLVTALGKGLGRSPDEGCFTYQPWQGDVEVSARMFAMTNATAPFRMGLLVRETLLEDARAVFFVVNQDGMRRIFYRNEPNQGQVSRFSAVAPPWLKLVRRGNTFSTLASKDGVHWSWQASVEVPMSRDVFVGFCVAATDPDVSFIARFDDLHVNTPSALDPVIGTGDGLTGTYLDQSTGQAVTHLDPQVNFVWRNRSPLQAIARTNLVVRWDGLLQAQYNERYRFHVYSEGTVKLWLNGRLLFEQSSGSTPREKNAGAPLKAGSLYPLRLEYSQASPNSTVRLMWSSRSTGRTPIPQTQLYSLQSPVYATIAAGGQGGLTNSAGSSTDTNAQATVTDTTNAVQVAGPGGDPLPAGVQAVTNVFEVAGSNAVSQSGLWAVEGASVYALEGRGGLQYLLSAPAADMYRVEFQGGSRDPNDPNRDYEMQVWIDGEYLGRRVLSTLGPTPGLLHVLTPWLRPGIHTVRIFWDGAVRERSLQVDAVRLQVLQGPDLNNNGIKDWVEQRLYLLCGVEFAPQFSAVSPACIEGRGGFLSMMAISGGIAPQAGAGQRWYADIPLSPAQARTVLVSFQNGGLRATNQISWSPTDLLQRGDITIRTGDSLLLAAAPVGATNGRMQISIVGVTNYTGSVSRPVACCFSSPGVYSAIGNYISSSGQSQSQTVSVTVVSASLGPSPAVWSGKWRLWHPSVPANISLQADPRVALDALPAPGSASIQYAMTAAHPDDYSLVARLGTNGPVVTNLAIGGFRLFGGYETGINHVTTYDDGSELVTMDLVFSPLRAHVRVHLEVNAGGVLFDDGTTAKDLTAADFDALGRTTVRFIRPPTFKTSVCHSIAAYQNGVLLGVYP